MNIKENIEKFEPELLTYNQQELYRRGAGDIISNTTNFTELEKEVFGECLAPGNVMLYMYRRFGSPNCLIDEHKEGSTWIVSTPMEYLFLKVGVSGYECSFGYRTNQELNHKLHRGYSASLFEWRDKVIEFAKDELGEDMYSTSYTTIFQIPTEKIDGKRIFCDKQLKIAIKEYNKWCIDNDKALPDNSKEDKEQFFGEFGEYKLARVNEIIKLYEEKYGKLIQTDETIIIEAYKAIKTTMENFKKFTYIRDVYFNIKGENSENFDNEYDFCDYFDPNNQTEALGKENLI